METIHPTEQVHVSENESDEGGVPKVIKWHGRYDVVVHYRQIGIENDDLVRELFAYPTPYRAAL